MDTTEATEQQLTRDPSLQHLTANAGWDILCAQGNSQENASWNSSFRHGGIQGAHVPSLIPGGLLSFEIKFSSCENKDGYWNLWAYTGITAFSPGRESKRSLSSPHPALQSIFQTSWWTLVASLLGPIIADQSLSLCHVWPCLNHLFSSLAVHKNHPEWEIQFPSESNEVLDRPKQPTITQTLL